MTDGASLYLPTPLPLVESTVDVEDVNKVICDTTRSTPDAHLLPIYRLFINSSRLDRSQTPLFRACAQGNVDVVRNLLSIGADVNKKSSLQRSRLIVPTYEKVEEKEGQSKDGVAIFYDGLRVNIDDSYYDERYERIQNTLVATPLYIACHNGHDKVVASLLDHPGVDVNATSECISVNRYPGEDYEWSCKRTAMWTACEKGHVECVRLLLQHPNTRVNEEGDMLTFDVDEYIYNDEAVNIIQSDPDQFFCRDYGYVFDLAEQNMNVMLLFSEWETRRQMYCIWALFEKGLYRDVIQKILEFRDEISYA